MNDMALPNPAPVSRKADLKKPRLACSQKNCAKSWRVRSLTCARLSSYWEVSFQCLAYFLGDPPTLSVFYPSPNSRDGSLEGADKDVFGQGTLHEVQCLLGVLMSMTHCINPRTTLNTAATSAAQGMTGRLASDQPPGKADNGHRHQRNNSRLRPQLRSSAEFKTTSNTTAPHIHTPSPVVSKPA